MDTPILIIDDDRELCTLLAEYLGTQGFDVSSVNDGSEALVQLQQHRYRALVLDIMLPGMRGLDVLRALRQTDTTPVLMLTARGEDTDRIIGLELGADDYLPKPCNPRELAARLRAILRRSDTSSAAPPSRLVVGATTIDRGDRSAHHRGVALQLTNAEFNLLAILMAQAGAAVDKDTLSTEGLGRPLSSYDRSVDVHVSKIRKKLAAAGGDKLILSVRGAGYQFVSRGGA